MGEVRVKVKLTNTLDRDLARRGQIASVDVRTYEADALIDTGAVSSVVPANIMNQLGLQSDGQHVALYADGRNEVVQLTKPITSNIFGRESAEGATVLGNEVIIGQTILEVLDLLVDSNRRQVVPNPAHPDHQL